jgi:hypothetical protein
MHNIYYLQAMTPMYRIVLFFGGNECGKKNSLPQSSVVKAKDAYLSNSINYIL